MLTWFRPARLLTALALFAAVFAFLIWIGQLTATATAPLSANGVGHRLLSEGRAYDAALVFEDPIWKGLALFRANRFQRAAAAFAQQESVQAQYNLAVSYVYLSRYKDAETTFRAVLSRDPAHEDARHNLKLLRDLPRDKEDTQQTGQSADQGGERKKAADSGSEGSENGMAAPQLKQDQAESSSGNTKRDPNEINPSEATQTQLGGAGSEQQRADLLKKIQERAPGEADDPEEKPGDSEEAGRHANNKPSDQQELAIADQVRFRQVVDRPAVVLKARLQAAASIRRGAKQ